MRHFKDQQGMTLIEIVMAMSIMGVIALGVMHLSKNTSDLSKRNYISVDYAALAHEFYFLLSKNASCTASLRGLQFSTGDYNFINPELEETRGIDIHLKHSNRDFSIIKTKYCAADSQLERCQLEETPSLNKAGKISIRAVKLSMPYLVPGHVFTGELKHQAVIILYPQVQNGVMQNSEGESVPRIKRLPPIQKNVMLHFGDNGTGAYVITYCEDPV